MLEPGRGGHRYLSRRIGLPVRVQATPSGQLCAFTWRDNTYRVRMLRAWRLATRWWDTGREADRTHYRIETTDDAHQIFELYRDAAQSDVWVLDTVLD